MGFLDAVKQFIQPYEEDDEFFGEDSEPADEAPSLPTRSASRREQGSSLFAAHEHPAAPERSAAERPAAPAQTSVRRDTRDNQVVNIHTTTAVQVVLAKPERFDQAAEIANHLGEKRTVVMNLENTDKNVARRLVDFLSGVAYANNGKIKKVAVNTYIITPYNVDIMGDLIDELETNGVHF